MWALRNQTPYGADRSWVRDRSGQHLWVVAVRASFDLDASGTLRLADEQPPPAHAAAYFAQPGASSLRADAELGLGKPGTDVIVNASAHAPRGKEAPSVPVALRIGALYKVLIVHGERVYVSRGDGIETSAARPFVTRPIRYEVAFGGSDTSSADPREHLCDPRNPIGRGVVAAKRRRRDQLAHAIEYPAQDARHAGPAGFGAIDRAWLPRRSYAGTYDARWERDKKPFLPDDYDDRFAHCAPHDQQLPEPLRGGERVELTHLTPEGKLTFLLPSLRLSFETAFGARTRQHEAKLATVQMDADERKLVGKAASKMSPHIESVERYLLSIVPNLAAEWEGASEDEIASIQALTPHPLPPFYVWFLRRMGRSMGPMKYPLVDFSVKAILAAYADTEESPIDQEWMDEACLMIGYNRDNVMPLHLWYDLKRRTPDDALVIQGYATTRDATPDFSTFAEMLIWGEAGSFRVRRHAQRCSGSFTDDAYEPFACLDPVMDKLGFHQPVAMQDHCRVYEREDATMICSGSLDEERDEFRFYRLGAPDEATIRSILGTIGHETRLLVKAKKWEPPLTEP